MHRDILAKRFVRSIIKSGIILLTLIPLASGAALGQQYPSARIESLGGSALSGIIPDTLTDIHLNPAYLHRCSGLTINYGQRRTGNLQLRFPRMIGENLSRDYINSYNVTELTLLGIRAGSWKIGLSAGWFADFLDNTVPGNTTHIYYDYIIETYAINSYHRDNHNYRVDLSLSREITPATAIGIRVGGFHRTYIYERAIQRQRFEFDIDDLELDDLIEYESNSHERTDNHKQVASFFLQAGLLTDSGGSDRSILLQVSRNEIYSKYSDKGIYATTFYDQFGRAARYEYGNEHYRDEREGVLWTYDIMGRFSLPNGMRIFAGGGYERMKYETGWIDSRLEYEWFDDWVIQESEIMTSLLFDGEEEYRGFNFFLKAGRTTELRERLRLTAGMHGYMRWSRSKEDPVALITLYSRVDSALITVPLERKLEISTETTDAALSIPLAIEYEPAGWISIWSGFRIYATYRREKDRLPWISAVDVINYLDPSMILSYLEDMGMKTEDDVDISSTATFGLSIHYHDRFFVDLHTASDITPDSIDRYILDVRYAF